MENSETLGIHYCYYFTYRGQAKGAEKVLRIDTWVSQNEVVEVGHSWSMESILQGQAVAVSVKETVAEYMDGYTKQEISYKTAEEMFPRGIVAWSNERIKIIAIYGMLTK